MAYDKGMIMIQVNKYLLPAATLALGVAIGQASIISAINPERLRSEAFKLARVAYTLGCEEVEGHTNCVNKGARYELIIRAKLPIKEEDL